MKLPRLERGRISLYSRRNCSISIFAWIRFLNHCIARHSSRDLPLNDSLESLCQAIRRAPPRATAVPSAFHALKEQPLGRRPSATSSSCARRCKLAQNPQRALAHRASGGHRSPAAKQREWLALRKAGLKYPHSTVQETVGGTLPASPKDLTSASRWITTERPAKRYQW